MIENTDTPRCLHCAIMQTIGDWFDAYGDRADDGVFIIDIELVLQKLMECAVVCTERAGDPEERTQAFQYAHYLLDWYTITSYGLRIKLLMRGLDIYPDLLEISCGK